MTTDSMPFDDSNSCVLPAAASPRSMTQAAFHDFYQKTAPAIRSYVCRSCGDWDLAEDLMQETFLRFLRSAPASMDEKARKAYLYRTADSLLVDHWRSAKRNRLLSAEASAERVVPDRSRHDETEEAFRKLKPQQRSLLWLSYVEGFDHREIAEASGLKEKSIKVLLFRARRAFAAILEGK